MVNPAKGKGGIALRAARELRGLTQKQAGALIRRTPSSITYFESGRYKPTLETALDIKREFGVAPCLWLDPLWLEP